MPATTHDAVQAVWRIESAKIVAGVARLVRDIGLAEELAHDVQSGYKLRLDEPQLS